MTRAAVAAAISAFAVSAVACVPMRPLEPIAPDAQGDLGTPTQQTLDSAPANTQKVAFVGDSFSADVLASVSANAEIDATAASILSADYLTWKLTRKPVDNTTKMARYTFNMKFSPVVGSQSSSFLTKLKALAPTVAESFVRPNMLASDVAKGNVSVSTPSANLVVLQFGTDDFCSGTSVEEFSAQYELALTRMASSFPNAKILALPVLNLDAIAASYPATHSVSGFAGTTPTCGEMREMLNSCNAISGNTRSLGDIAKMNAAIENAISKITNQQPNRALFVNWNASAPSATIDCTHANTETLARMAENAWPDVQKFMTK